MQTILIAVRDPILADQIRAGLRNFSSFRGVVLDPGQLEETLAANPSADAILFEHPGSTGELEDLVLRLQSDGKPRRLLVLGDRHKRKETHRAKVALGLFSFVPLPLDPFDLLRKLHRLRADLLADRSPRRGERIRAGR